MDDTERRKILREFSYNFNSRNHEEIFLLFGEAARAQVSQSDMVKQFVMLENAFGEILDGAYSHSKFIGSQGSANVYEIYYTLRVPAEGATTAKANLKITVLVENERYQIFGFFLTQGEMSHLHVVNTFSAKALA